MKKLILLVFIVMVIATGCESGKVEEEAETTEEVTITEITTTEKMITTTEEQTTEVPFEPLIGQGVHWRTLDLDKNADIKEALQDEGREPKTEYWLSKTVKVYEKRNDTYGQEIWMQDTKTGKEEILLAQKGEVVSYILDVIDDRYFLFLNAWIDSEFSRTMHIYDTLKKQEIPVSCPDGEGWYWGMINGKIYMVDANSDYEGDGEFRVLTIDIKALQRGKSVVAVNILKGTTGIENLPATASSALSPDARYLAARTLSRDEGRPPHQLFVFDVTQRKLILDLEQPKELDLNRIKFTNKNTLYWFNYSLDGDVLEITLP